AGRVAAPTGVHRWFTWRRALLGGAAGFTLLGLGTGVYMAMRLVGIGPVGTLVASGVLAERDRLVLADFENRTADSTLGPSLTEALRVDLAQSGVIRLLDAAAVGQALGRMGRAPGASEQLVRAWGLPGSSPVVPFFSCWRFGSKTHVLLFVKVFRCLETNRNITGSFKRLT